ncbi:uncharacterized protein [Centruroides vittatus]|uniref:uncharacterized protein n=1 Tax=Centruroides vittatus TaxID=120091 RepID=UPI0035102614
MIDIDEEISKIQGIKFYKRYVDDILIIYDDQEIMINNIKTIINNINEEIQFTAEEKNKTNKSINYLDVTIKRNDYSLEFKPYKKPCSIVVTIRYDSNIPSYIKQNIFKMEYTKIITRTSNPTDIHTHTNELKKKFVLNGYPNSLINHWENKINSNMINNKVKKLNTDTKYISFPYIKELYEDINRDLQKMSIKLAPKYEKLQNRLRPTKPNRKPEKKEETRNVVYKIPCTCNTTNFYIGETKRKLGIRLKEHIADLKYHRLNSVFHDHCLLNDCNIDENNVQILYKEKDMYNRKFKESVSILTANNCINKNLSIKISENWFKIL